MKNILDKIRIDYSTYLLIILGLLAGYIKNIFIILVIVIIHEFGHVFFFSLFNIKTIKNDSIKAIRNILIIIAFFALLAIFIALFGRYR